MIIAEFIPFTVTSLGVNNTNDTKPMVVSVWWHILQLGFEHCMFVHLADIYIKKTVCVKYPFVFSVAVTVLISHYFLIQQLKKNSQSCIMRVVCP